MVKVPIIRFNAFRRKYACDEDIFDGLIDNLKKKELYKPNLLFRGFDGVKIRKVIRDGYDTLDGRIFAVTEACQREQYAYPSDNPTLLDYADQSDFDIHAVMVLKRNFLEPNKDDPSYNSLNLDLSTSWKFKDLVRAREAVVAVYRLISE